MNMLMTPATKFLSGSGEWVSLSDMVTRINLFLGDIEEYSLEVGTDSQTNGQTKFVTAIVVHKSGKGGIFFYHPHITKKIHVLSERIYTETALSINCATLLLEMFLEMDILREITIHCDVGSKGKTRELIREIVGYVTASGFDCKIKPEATTACTVADKFSK